MTGMNRDDILLKAQVLTEALPFIKKHSGKTIVIKYGGNAMENEEIRETFASDVVLMRYIGIKPIIIHGGGPQITHYMQRLAKEPVFIDGHRVTDSETMEIAEMVLVGKVNKEIVSLINRHGAHAMGLSGEDGRLIIASKRQVEGGVDLGWVGEVDRVNVSVIEGLFTHDLIPVLASVGTDDDGNSYNINADLVAGEIAAALKADRVIYMTNVEGILDRDGALIPNLNPDECRRLINDGDISSGMLPKVESCLEAIANGVRSATVLDGTIEHALLLELFTSEGVGTMIADASL